MLNRQKLIVSLALALVLSPASASAAFVYVVNDAQQFGTVNLANGAFHQIGPNVPEFTAGLVPVSNGSLLTLTASGNLDSINPATGVTVLIGPTGLADCSLTTSPCGPTSANAVGALAGTVYATDFQGNLYSVNPSTGATKLIGPTGIPAVPAIPFTVNPDGSTNVFDEDLFAAGGKLYANFDALTLAAVTSAPTAVIPATLYQIDPATGHATVIAPTDLSLTAIVNVNGTTYAFNGVTGQVVSLNLATGGTSFVSNVDPAAGLVFGAAPVPEPASMALAGIGVALIAFSRRRRRRGLNDRLALSQTTIRTGR